MSAKQLALFTRQLATLNRVSPLEESLRTITRQTEQETVRTIVAAVHAGVVEGRRLAEAMGREPKSFPPLYRAMVSAGERSGSLPVILERLSVLLERQAEINGKIITTLAYPAVLAVVAMGVVTALMMFVVPQVVEQFDTVGQELPLLTKIVIGISGLPGRLLVGDPDRDRADRRRRVARAQGSGDQARLRQLAASAARCSAA